MNTESYKLQ